MILSKKKKIIMLLAIVILAIAISCGLYLVLFETALSDQKIQVPMTTIFYIIILWLVGLIVGICMVVFILPLLVEWLVQKIFTKTSITDDNETLHSVEQARDLQSAGNITAAIDMYYQLGKADVSNKTVWLELFDLMLAENKIELCYQYVKEAITLNSWNDADKADLLFLQATIEDKSLSQRTVAVDTYKSILDLKNASNLKINQTRKKLFALGIVC